MSIINILIVASLAYLLEATLAVAIFVIFRKRIMRRVAYILDGERDHRNIPTRHTPHPCSACDELTCEGCEEVSN